MTTQDRNFELAFQPNKVPVWFNGEEILHLTDAIDNRDVADGLPNKESYVPLARDILLLLGGAYLELVGAEGRPSRQTVMLVLDENQLFLLRSKVKSSEKESDQMTNLGRALLRKLYTAILQLHNGVELSATVIGDQHVTKDEIEAAIAHAEEEARNAVNRTSSNSGPNQDDVAVS